MKHKRILLSVAMVALFGTVLPRQAEARVSFSYFYDNLDPYGEWVDVGDYGYCWRPTGVDADWRPYTDGYWVYTDAGWTWVSYEDFGAITYHYGRWTDVADVGWVWVPDYQWGPAWVSWRHSDTYVGWAPLPPEAHFSASIGFSVWVDRDYDIGPRYYSFCDVHHFGDPVLRNVIVPPAQNVNIINNTVNITNITVNKTVNNNTIVYNGGPDYNTLARASARPIQALKLQRQTEVAPGRGRPQLARAVGNSLVVAAPEIEKPAQRIAPPKVARVIKQPKIEHGWAGTAPEQRQQIEQKFKQETKGLTRETAPAKPVSMEKIARIVPAKADPHGTPGGLKKTGAAAETATTQEPPAGAPGHKGKGKLQPFTAEPTPGQPATAGAETPSVPAAQGQAAMPGAHGKKGKHAGQQPGASAAVQGEVSQQAATPNLEEQKAERKAKRQAEQQQAAEAARARQEQQAEARAKRQAEAEQQQQHAAEAARARQEQQAEARAQRQAEAQQQRAAEGARARQEQQAEARAQRQAEAQQQRAAEGARARQEQQAEARAQRQAEAQQERAAEAARARQQQQAEMRQQMMQQQAQRPHPGGGGRGQGQGEDERGKKKHRDDQNQ